MKGIRNSKAARAGWRIATIAGSGAMALAFGLLMTAMPAAAAAGPTCTVPGDYSTIQGAVNDTNCTTINVAVGPYNENVTIGHALTLNGANAGIDARNAAARGPESVIDGGSGVAINIQVEGVTVDGFTVKSSGGYGVEIQAAAADAVVRNNVFDGITSGSSTAQAVYLVHGTDRAMIAQNVIENVSGVGSTKGVYIGDSNTVDPAMSDSVVGNIIRNVTSSAAGAYGVMINNGAHLATPTPNPGLMIENNTIANLSGS